MTFEYNNIYNFIYIAVIILGGIVMTLTLILYEKEKDKGHRAMFLFIASVFVFMILDFVTYYYLGEDVSGNLVFALITTSDIFFCVLTAAWVYLIVVMIDAEQVIKMRWVVILTVVYQISSQILSISLGRYDSYALHVDGGAGKVALQIINASYTAIIVLIGIKCVTLLFKKYRKGLSRNVNLVLELLLIGYMVWIAYWDYSTWYKTEDNLISIYAMDPLILLYAILNIALIYYFYKKDPLKLMNPQITMEEAVKLVAEQYGLSEREREVLELMNCGKSNGQIAGELNISENTVKRHTSNIFKKTNTGSRHEIMYKVTSVNSSDFK